MIKLCFLDRDHIKIRHGVLPDFNPKERRHLTFAKSTCWQDYHADMVGILSDVKNHPSDSSPQTKPIGYGPSPSHHQILTHGWPPQQGYPTEHIDILIKKKKSRFEISCPVDRTPNPPHQPYPTWNKLSFCPASTRLTYCQKFTFAFVQM